MYAYALIRRIAIAYIPRHYSKANKQDAAFVARYPYSASNAALFAHFVDTLGEAVAKRTFVMDSAYTSCAVFQALLDRGCHAVGSLKFPFCGVPQSRLWSKEDRRAGHGDCRHTRSVDGKLGVQQWKVQAVGFSYASAFGVAWFAHAKWLIPFACARWAVPLCPPELARRTDVLLAS